MDKVSIAGSGYAGYGDAIQAIANTEPNVPGFDDGALGTIRCGNGNLAEKIDQ